MPALEVLANEVIIIAICVVAHMHSPTNSHYDGKHRLGQESTPHYAAINHFNSLSAVKSALCRPIFLDNKT